MTRTNPADEVPKRSWVLDEDGRWTLNPAVVQVTHEMMRCLVSLKKFDAGWESFGPNAIQQFYNLMRVIPIRSVLNTPPSPKDDPS